MTKKQIIYPSKLHIWYLQACKILDRKDYNELAQKPYKKLTKEQKFIDIYIANKINEKIKKRLKVK